MPFAKAEPKQGYLKVMLWGPSGSGKTLTSLLFAEGLAKKCGKRIAFVDTENGSMFYSQRVPSREVHPEAFDFDALYTRSIKECIDDVTALDLTQYGVIVIDSMSHIWEAAVDAYEGRMVGRDQDKIPMNAWGKIKKPYKQFIDWLMSCPAHVFILARQKNIFREINGELTFQGIGAKVEGDTPYEPHINIRMKAEGKNVILEVDKDRSGVLSGGVYVNPRFTIIEPILEYLGSEQAPAEDTEDRVAKDGQLLDAEDEKARQKVEQSESLVAEFQGRICAATSLQDLAKISTELKASRKILPEGKEVLRGVYDGRRIELGRRAAGGM